MMYDELSHRILLELRKKGMARFRDLKSVIGNPRTLTIKLEKLKRLELIEVKNGLYELTSKGVEVCRVIENLRNILHSPEPRIENVERIPHQYYAQVVRRYCELLREVLGDRLLSVMLFGSIARGDWDKNSDIDILIVAEGWEDKPAWVRIKELRRAKEALEASPEYSESLRAGYYPIIQNYCLNVEEAKRFNRIYLDAVLDGIMLYDKNSFLTAVLQSLRKRLEEMGSVRVTLPGKGFYWILKDVKAGEVITLE
ncbi:MAG: nucleotidyltransferase domain-containing protein [Candidatus Brockarchaeota archaeon]|nr:nucleotidyltransferase domain-containing protein [Candidatus Brockarchaeota archaeon]